MKRLILAFALLLPAVAESATIAHIKTLVETFYASRAVGLAADQEVYRATYGTYWQGIVTPGTVPDNGATVAGDYTRKPTDHAERWSDFFTGGHALPPNIPAQIQIDVYGGPLGQGWTITVRGTKGGVLLQRSWAVGPETWREKDWQECVLPCTLP